MSRCGFSLPYRAVRRNRAEHERLCRNWEGRIELKELLKNNALNGWSLFWLISAPMSLIMVMAMMGRDMTNPEDVSHMIGFSVRWAVPFIFLVVATSSLQKLFPGPVPGWLLRNRKYTGLCFAVAMGWQGLFIFMMTNIHLFIFMMTNIHRGYYFEEIFYLRDELEGSTGYLFLAAMVVTSFKFGRRLLTPKQWRLLHLSGLYFLFAYAQGGSPEFAGLQGAVSIQGARRCSDRTRAGGRGNGASVARTGVRFSAGARMVRKPGIVAAVLAIRALPAAVHHRTWHPSFDKGQHRTRHGRTVAASLNRKGLVNVPVTVVITSRSFARTGAGWGRGFWP